MGGYSCEYVLVKIVRWFQWPSCGTLSLRGSFVVGEIQYIFVENQGKTCDQILDSSLCDFLSCIKLKSIRLA
jgi:hypothetical protein